MNHFQALREAVPRVDAWWERYGLTAQWSFGPENLILTARKGNWRSKQKLPWELFEQAREPDVVLRGCEDTLLHHFNRRDRD